MCAITCGLEMEVEDNRIVNVRPDPDNPRSKGYCCRKGRSSKYLVDHGDRLKHPMKRVGDEFVQISWEQAFREIADKLKEILDQYGPRAIAAEGIAGVSVQGEAAYAITFLKLLRSQYFYAPLAAELTGIYWGYGRILGKQYNYTEPDEENADVIVAWGWNGYASHQMARGREVFREFSGNPEKMIISIDPRISETARMADMHLAVRSGCDALLARAAIALILRKGWQKQEYIDRWVADFDQVKHWFEDVDIEAACRVCEISCEKLREFCKILTTRNWCTHYDLGVAMNRHSTLTTYLIITLLIVCGRLLVPGGNVVMGTLAPIGAHTDERNPKTWKTLKTGFAPIISQCPPNVVPEEIMNDHPERLRAMIMSQTNPMRSYAETSAYEEALPQLDLLVYSNICMCETAKYAHYLLPVKSGYESYDTSYLQWSYPNIFTQMKHPVVQAEGDCRETTEIWAGIADAMGIIPPIPDSLYDAAKNKHRLEFAGELMAFFKADRKNAAAAPFIISKTLGAAWGSTSKAWLWAMLMTSPRGFQESVARAGFQPGPKMMDDVFQALCDHPEGVWIGKEDPAENFKKITHEDGKMHLFAEEMDEWIREVTPEREAEALKMPDDYPFILNAGSHVDGGANGVMRNPATYVARNPCRMLIHPEDAGRINLADGKMARVTTDTGEVEIEAEYSYNTRRGSVIIPHQFGFDFQGKRYGVGVNRLTNARHRDRIAATPYHRRVACRVEAL